MTSSAIVDRYASALADVVTSPSSTISPQDALQQLRSFDDLAQESHELRTALDSPAVSHSRKRAVISRFVQLLSLAPIVRNFLFVLSDKRRLSALHEIVDSFDVQLDERLGFIRADVTAAAELNPSQLEALTQKLAAISGKQIRLRFRVDQKLIGGVVARMGSTVYDGSVRGRLDNLSRQLSVY
jgi:F-type H+-transporting ATPase subunit delta